MGVLEVQKTTGGEKIMGMANDKKPSGKVLLYFSGRRGVMAVLGLKCVE